MSTVIWTTLILFLILLGIFRPKWLLTLFAIAFALCVVGVMFVILLILIGKLLGNGKNKDNRRTMI